MNDLKLALLRHNSINFNRFFKYYFAQLAASKEYVTIVRFNGKLTHSFHLHRFMSKDFICAGEGCELCEFFKENASYFPNGHQYMRVNFAITSDGNALKLPSSVFPIRKYEINVFLNYIVLGFDYCVTTCNYSYDVLKTGREVLSLPKQPKIIEHLNYDEVRIKTHAIADALTHSVKKIKQLLDSGMSLCEIFERRSTVEKTMLLDLNYNVLLDVYNKAKSNSKKNKQLLTSKAEEGEVNLEAVKKSFDGLFVNVKSDVLKKYFTDSRLYVGTKVNFNGTHDVWLGLFEQYLNDGVSLFTGNKLQVSNFFADFAKFYEYIMQEKIACVHVHFDEYQRFFTDLSSKFTVVYIVSFLPKRVFPCKNLPRNVVVLNCHNLDVSVINEDRDVVVFFPVDFCSYLTLKTVRKLKKFKRIGLTVTNLRNFLSYYDMHQRLRVGLFRYSNIALYKEKTFENARVYFYPFYSRNNYGDKIEGNPIGLNHIDIKRLRDKFILLNPYRAMCVLNLAINYSLSGEKVCIFLDKIEQINMLRKVIGDLFTVTCDRDETIYTFSNEDITFYAVSCDTYAPLILCNEVKITALVMMSTLSYFLDFAYGLSVFLEHEPNLKIYDFFDMSFYFSQALTRTRLVFYKRFGVKLMGSDEVKVKL